MHHCIDDRAQLLGGGGVSMGFTTVREGSTAGAEVGYRATASPSPGPVISRLPGGQVVKSLGAKVQEAGKHC